jgi:UDPglucose 6-dehydrogenase
MNIGMIGLGALGKAIATTIDYKGHNVFAYDIDSKKMNKDELSTLEVGPDGTGKLVDYLKKSNITFCPMKEVLEKSDITFIAVQTPHEPLYSGEYRVPNQRKDFDYGYLIDCMNDVNRYCAEIGKPKIVAIISTVLPGTLNRNILPYLQENVKLCYNPFFPAQTTFAPDFLNSEFILLGLRDKEASEKLKEFYSTINNAPIREMSIKSAEITKVLYNLFITMKIGYANTIMELCHAIPGANLDDVTGTLKLATKRLISTSYLDGGMPDSGPCHSRDAIAMSYLAKTCNLSHNFFDDFILAREAQIDWFVERILLAKQCITELEHTPVIILGKAFKPESNITSGSAAVLLANILKEKKIWYHQYDPYIETYDPNMFAETTAVYFIATKHKIFKTYKFSKKSFIIDPFRYIEDQPGVYVMRIGE